ncbi:hypothetical protein VSH64_36575 [Amycolatopsis rhabdoformis]|uniref:Uncharacterized protein n=1 Tax=Amycolatopsis rhabdoformis TaxID=1448059 RepID=A0ABZ1I479_9PSEU|nr:hypothetical protein [Amycolatopsis rhabdoformis]WSE28313.1 hypothetical protein VSH64_36575 [Amycolatopsis rhabdoformis]
MAHRTRRATAVGAAAFVLAGSAALAAPSTASAAPATLTTTCGSTITAHPGDKVQIKTLLGPVDLGLVGKVSGVLTGAVDSVLGALCKVTVNVVDTVVAPVPVVGAPAAGALNQTVAGTTNTLQQGVDSTQRALSGGAPAQQNPGSPQQPPATGPGAPQGGNPAGQTPIPPVNSPLLPLSGGGGGGGLGSLFPGFANFSNLPFSTGYAPMRDYSDIPMAMAGLFSPSPALRYGSQIPGYAPQYGLSNPGQPSAGNASVQNAGEAQALPLTGDDHTNGLDWPVLVAVLALSGVSAGLVRTWVLRRMAAAS